MTRLGHNRLLPCLLLDRGHLEQVLLHFLYLLHLVLRRHVAASLALLRSVPPISITHDFNLRLNIVVSARNHVLNLPSAVLHVLRVDLLDFLVPVQGL